VDKLTYLERFEWAIEHLTAASVPTHLVQDWIDETNDNLQDWVGSQEIPWWCQNIAIIEAALAMANSPVEGAHDEIDYSVPWDNVEEVVAPPVLSVTFTEDEADTIQNHARSVEEVLIEERKGAPQAKYVMCVPTGCEEWNPLTEKIEPVPEHLVGHWMMEYAANLNYRGFRECIKRDSWVRCHAEAVTEMQWVEG